MKENLCVQSGCPGFCCQDTDIEVTKFERRKLFPNAVRLNTLKELRGGCLQKGFAYNSKLLQALLITAFKKTPIKSGMN